MATREPGSDDARGARRARGKAERERAEAERKRKAGDADLEAAKPFDPRLLLEIGGAAAGIAAFIALIGGALLWLRFDELGLPADRAVAALPKSMLLTVGAHQLFAPAAAGLLAVVLLFAVRPETWWGWARRLAAAVLAAAIVVAGLAAVGSSVASWIATGVLAAALAVGALVVLKVRWPWWIASAFAAAAVALGVLALIDHPWAWWLTAGALAAALAAWPLYELLAWLDEKGFKFAARAPTLAVLAIALVGVGVHSLSLDWFPHLTLVAITTLAGVAAIVRTARGERRTRPVAWVVFVSFLAVGAAVALARTANAPKMEPVAVLLKDPSEVVAGFLVGDSGDRLYVAELGHADDVFVPAASVDTVIGVSRDRTVRTLTRRPAGVGTDDEGRGQAQALVRGLREEARPPEPATVGAPKPADRAKAFAPLLHLHTHDRIAPTSADYFVERSALLWKHRGCKSHVPPRTGSLPAPHRGAIDAGALGSGRYRHPPGCGHGAPAVASDALTRPYARRPDRARGAPGDEGFYLDLDDDRAVQRPKLEKRIRRDGPQAIFTNVGADTPVYWEEHDAGRGRKRLTYWFFYPLSIPPGTGAVGDRFAHEGDWEGMSVLLAPERPGDDRRWTPQSVRFNAHHTPADVPWARVQKATGPDGRATHPVGFVAQNSHATYAAAGRYEQTLRSGGSNVIRVDDVAFSCPDCPVWITWLNVRPVEEQGWYGFGGAWGEVGDGGDGTGPLGPSRYRAGPARPDPEESLKGTAP